MIATHDEVLFKKLLPYTNNQVYYEIGMVNTNGSIGLLIKKEHYLNNFEANLDFEKMQKDFLNSDKWFYDSAEDFIESISEVINSKKLFIVEADSVMELSYEVIILKKTIKVSIKVNRINKPIQQSTIIKIVEDQMLRLSLLEKKNEQCELLNVKLNKENIALKEKYANLLIEFNRSKEKRNQKIDNKLIPLDDYKLIPIDDYKFINDCLPVAFKNFKPILLWMATLHGFQDSDFHLRVKGIPNTLFIGTTEGGIRFGAFSVVSFEGSDNTKDDPSLKSFLFSLTKKTKATLLKKEGAICDSSSYGPIYGNGTFSDGIRICSNSNTSNGCFSALNNSYDLKEILFEKNSKMKELEFYKI